MSILNSKVQNKTMKQNYKKFDEIHQELINSFIRFCLADKNFLNSWRFIETSLSMGGSISHFPSGQKLTQIGQDLIKELRGKFESCIGLMLQDRAILKPKKDTKGLFFRLTLTDLLDVYAELIKKHDLAISPNEKLFSALGYFRFQEYKKYIFSKTQVFKIRIFLANFNPTFQEKSIRLLPNLILEKIDISYLHSNKNLLDVFGFRSEAALVVELKTKKFGNIGDWGQNSGGMVFNNFQYPRKEVEIIIQKALTTFRLLRDGDVGVFLIQYEPPDPFSRQMNLPIPADYQVATQGLQYRFGDVDLPEFIKISKRLELLNRITETRICVSRFNKSFIRNDPADQLIDLVIAMESITTPEKDSLTYKVSTQIARLLINDDDSKVRVEKRKELQEKITKIYNIRSKLVHRGKIKRKDLKPFETSEKAVCKAREIVRQINLTLAELLSSNKFEDIIDNAIFF